MKANVGRIVAIVTQFSCHVQFDSQGQGAGTHKQRGRMKKDLTKTVTIARSAHKFSAPKYRPNTTGIVSPKIIV